MVVRSMPSSSPRACWEIGPRARRFNTPHIWTLRPMGPRRRLASSCPVLAAMTSRAPGRSAREGGIGMFAAIMPQKSGPSTWRIIRLRDDQLRSVFSRLEGASLVEVVEEAHRRHDDEDQNERHCEECDLGGSRRG